MINTHQITWMIGQIDESINNFLNQILHHPDFQKLEATWRNLQFLAEQARTAHHVKIRVLNLSWAELERDLNKALEFDQNELFKKIYEQEFGMPGGEPYGLIVADYPVCIKSSVAFSGSQHVATLAQLAQVAAAAFVPVILNVDCQSFEIEDMGALENLSDFERLFKQPEFHAWRQFRATDNARFIGLVLPKVLLRLPYDVDYQQRSRFRFSEQCGYHKSDYLWGSAAFAFASIVLRSFEQSGWFMDSQGLHQGSSFGGEVIGLPRAAFLTDQKDRIQKNITEICLTDAQEKRLSEYGFIPLCQDFYTKNPIFYSASSVQSSQVEISTITELNTKISAMLHYLLCACRFAHYVKVIGRNKMGSFATPEECARYLNNWLFDYVASNQDLSLSQRAQYPLRKAHAEVKGRPGILGNFFCVLYLEPRFQLEQIETTFMLVTELASVVS